MYKLMILIMLCGCTENVNQKVALVERQKEINNEIDRFQDSADAHPLPQGFLEAHDGDYKVLHPHLDYLRKVNRLAKEYDSLQIELKKY